MGRNKASMRDQSWGGVTKVRKEIGGQGRDKATWKSLVPPTSTCFDSVSIKFLIARVLTRPDDDDDTNTTSHVLGTMLSFTLVFGSLQHPVRPIDLRFPDVET